jgi:hypothetical protein
MKLLTIGTIKDTFYTLPRAEQVKLNISAEEYNLKIKKQMGDKWHFYLVPGWDGMLVCITEVASVEELYQLLAQSPIVAAGFWKYKTYPLIETSVKSLEASLAFWKAAK